MKGTWMAPGGFPGMYLEGYLEAYLKKACWLWTWPGRARPSPLWN